MKKCAKCGEVKSSADFNRNRATKSGLQDRCKPCNKAAITAWRKKNPDWVRRINRAHNQKNRQRILERKRAQRAADPLRFRTRSRGYHLKLKAEVFAAYGGPRCACCREATPEFLSIDHVNGGGEKHRKEIGAGILRWLKRNRFPAGFQILCMNCQFGRKHNAGICPHQVRP